jgi:chemotaxis protein methyltransferase CheR
VPSVDALWPKVQSFTFKGCGVVLGDDQDYLLEPRLGPLTREFGHRSIAELVDAACTSLPSSPVARAVIDAMTTHESLFFRDLQFWRAFEEIVIPRVLESARGRKLRVWSAACSHGQEAYSLAILLAEKWPAVDTEILGTDVSLPAVERARVGLYTALEVNRGLSASRLVQHFQKEPGGFRLRKELRDRITWSVHNLLGSNSDFSGCDVVMCRNVLIYFSDRDRKTTLARIEASVRPEGFIAVGGTETTPRASIAPGWYTKQSAQRAGSL